MDSKKKSLGQVAFEAYTAATGTDVDGGQIPTWDSLSGTATVGWEEAAQAVLAEKPTMPKPLGQEEKPKTYGTKVS